MEINTLSAYETSAEEFFHKLASWKVDLVVDVRLHNTNQLAGFTKRNDLDYFVRTIQHADYAYDDYFSPDPEVLDHYLHGAIGWEDFAAAYRELMEERNGVAEFKARYGEHDSIALVGTATHKRRSHVEVLKDLLDNDEA